MTEATKPKALGALEAPGTTATAGAGRAGELPDAGRSARCKAHHPAFPRPDELRRVWPQAGIPAALRGPDLARTAHHEAAHVTLMQWAGLQPTGATASVRGGEARWDLDALIADTTTETDYDRPMAAAQAAAVYHAGIVGELIHAGLQWTGVLYRPRSQDWQSACFLLAPHFGHGLAGHGFAQRTALAVLSREWPRVQQIARTLIEDGRWTPPPEAPRS